MRELRDLRTQLRRDPVLEEPRETDPFASQRLDAELGAMAEAIVTRVRAERHDKLSAQVSRLFEDLHFVWAGLAAVSATAACAAIVAAVLHFAPAERADSLSGVLAALAAPGSDRNPMRLDEGTELPRVNEEDVMPAILVPLPAVATGRPVSLAIAGVLTQEGRVRNAALLPAGEYGDLDAQRVMHAMSSTRFHPAQLRGAPVAVSLIWLFEQTTVLGKTGV